MKDSEKNIEKIMKILRKHFNYKERTTLNKMRQENEDAFKILVSCLLSLRSRDETTERISKKLFKIADTPEKIADMDIDELKKIIFPTGHYNKKAETLKHVSSELIKRFDSKVPNDKEKLLSIKGIGPKTANIVLSFAFDEMVIPVDVHVHVVANRLGLVSAKTPEQTEKELEKVLPEKYWGEINGLFVLHGREYCQSFSPKCSVCPIRKNCPRVDVRRSR
jgi:endonuclease-3